LLAVVIVGTCAIACIIASAFNPARKSNEEIQAEMLERTPLGSSVGDVERVAGKFTDFHSYWVIRDGKKKKEINVVYGWYLTLHDFPIAPTVAVRWHFTPDGTLESIEVYRYL
jgi:hypothetical protein